MTVVRTQARVLQEHSSQQSLLSICVFSAAEQRHCPAKRT